MLAETLFVLAALLSLLLQYSTASLTSLTTARMALPATAVPRWNRVARCAQHAPFRNKADSVFSGETQPCVKRCWRCLDAAGERAR